MRVLKSKWPRCVRFFCSKLETEQELWKVGNKEAIKQFYYADAKNGDPHSQLLLGISLCQPDQSEQVSEPKNHYLPGGGYLLEIPSDSVPSVSNRPEFLRWVRKEKARLTSPKRTEEEPEEISQELIDGYYWILQSAHLKLPISMYLVGSLLIDQIITANQYESIQSRISNMKRSWDELETKKDGYLWLWRAALGDISYSSPPPAYPEEILWKENIESQCGLAWYDLGRAHYYGLPDISVLQSDSLSIKCFSFAANQHNDPDALFWLGFQVWPSDWKTIPVSSQETHPAWQYMRKAAQLGHSEAMFFLACRYIEQIYELFSDPSEESARVKLANAAVDWMQKSAEQGCQRALQALGDWYTQGTSQPPYFLVDYPKALRYYTLSTQVDSPFYPAEETNAMKSIAYCSLGAMYLRGLGTNQDLSLAVKFYQQAANLGNIQACFNLAHMHEHGIGVPVNKRTAARYQQLAQQRSLEQKH